uniref:Uncharacterized protein n=1 Tax=Anthurium amnicola TaxID=1678845 RepID=A0A1D1XGY8_9ARAE
MAVEAHHLHLFPPQQHVPNRYTAQPRPPSHASLSLSLSCAIYSLKTVICPLGMTSPLFWPPPDRFPPVQRRRERHGESGRRLWRRRLLPRARPRPRLPGQPGALLPPRSRRLRRRRHRQRAHLQRPVGGFLFSAPEAAARLPASASGGRGGGGAHLLLPRRGHHVGDPAAAAGGGPAHRPTRREGAAGAVGAPEAAVEAGGCSGGRVGAAEDPGQGGGDREDGEAEHGAGGAGEEPVRGEPDMEGPRPDQRGRRQRPPLRPRAGPGPRHGRHSRRCRRRRVVLRRQHGRVRPGGGGGGEEEEEAVPGLLGRGAVGAAPAVPAPLPVRGVRAGGGGLPRL